jgi:hypothetical protein
VSWPGDAPGEEESEGTATVLESDSTVLTLQARRDDDPGEG